MGNDGIITGIPTFVIAPSGFGECLSNQNGNYVTIPSTLVPPNGSDWTIRVRINTTDATSFMSPVSFGDVNGDTYSFIVVAGGEAGFYCDYGGTISGPPVADGNWHDIEVDYVDANGGLTALFVDGILIDLRSGQYVAPTSPEFIIGDIAGYLGENYGFNGLIDEVQVYSIQLHSGNFTPPNVPINSALGLTAVYHLDGNVNDFSVPQSEEDTLSPLQQSIDRTIIHNYIRTAIPSAIHDWVGLESKLRIARSKFL